MSNITTMRLFADAEFLHADGGISLDGVLKYEHGRPWKHFELLLSWGGMTLDFASTSLRLDGKLAGEGFAFFFEDGMHFEVTGPEYSLSAQLQALPDHPKDIHWRMNGLLKTPVTMFGFSLVGGIARPPLTNVVALRSNASSIKS